MNIKVPDKKMKGLIIKEQRTPRIPRHILPLLIHIIPRMKATRFKAHPNSPVKGRGKRKSIQVSNKHINIACVGGFEITASSFILYKLLFSSLKIYPGNSEYNSYKANVIIIQSNSTWSLIKNS